MTLRELLQAHPEWADLPIAVYDPENDLYHFLGASGTIYEATIDDPEPVDVLVVAGN